MRGGGAVVWFLFFSLGVSFALQLRRASSSREWRPPSSAGRRARSRRRSAFASLGFVGGPDSWPSRATATACLAAARRTGLLPVGRRCRPCGADGGGAQLCPRLMQGLVFCRIFCCRFRAMFCCGCGVRLGRSWRQGCRKPAFPRCRRRLPQADISEGALGEGSAAGSCGAC